MKKESFERIVKEVTIVNKDKTLTVLRTKEDFIDDLLQNESIDNIKDGLVFYVLDNNEKDKINHCRMNKYIKAIEGIEQTIYIETFYVEGSQSTKEIEQLQNIKITLIKTLANWLFNEEE